MNIEECKKCDKHDGIEGLHVKCKYEEEKGAWGKSGHYMITNKNGKLTVYCPME